MGLYYMKISEFEKAEMYLLQCTKIGSEQQRLDAIVRLAQNDRKMGDVPKARAILHENFEHADTDTPHYADALIQLGLCCYSEGRLEEALELYERAHEISERKQDHFITLYNELGIGTVLSDLGRMDEARDLMLKIYRETGKYGYIYLLSDSLNLISSILLKQGEYEDAVNYAKQGLVIWLHSNYYTGQMVMYCTILRALKHLKGREKEMAEYKNKADELRPIIREKVIIDIYEDMLRVLAK